MGTRLLRRRGLAAAGVLAAGLLSGCKTGSIHYSHAGVARGDGSGHPVPTSTAFARVSAGHTMTAHPIGGTVVSSPEMATVPNWKGCSVADNGEPMMTTGGMVMPAGYAPGSPMASMPAHPGSMMSMPMAAPGMPVQAMTIQTTMPAMGGPGTVFHGTPVTSTIAAPAMPPPGMTGTPTLMLIQGPNGPQYVITEVLSAVPLPMPSAAPMPMPMPAPIPAPAPMPVPAPIAHPAPAAPTPVMPAAAPVAAPVAAPAVTPVAIPPAAPVAEQMPVTPAPTPTLAPAPEPVPPPAPTLTAPPAPSGDVSFRAPDPLPRTMSMKPPTGPVLPASETRAPNLGSYPAAPSIATASAGPKLPPATGVTDDDIPDAPVFLPVAK